MNGASCDLTWDGAVGHCSKTTVGLSRRVGLAWRDGLSPALALDFHGKHNCGKHNITSDVEVIAIQQINEAYERMLKNEREVRVLHRHGLGQGVRPNARKLDSPRMIEQTTGPGPGRAKQEQWKGKINPGKVFDLVLSLDRVAEGYRAMDERRAIKALLRP